MVLHKKIVCKKSRRVNNWNGKMLERSPKPCQKDHNLERRDFSRPRYYPRLKHINRNHKFIMEAAREFNIQVLWCSGQNMLADGLTKAIGDKTAVEEQTDRGTAESLAVLCVEIDSLH